MSLYTMGVWLGGLKIRRSFRNGNLSGLLLTQTLVSALRVRAPEHPHPPHGEWGVGCEERIDPHGETDMRAMVVWRYGAPRWHLSSPRLCRGGYTYVLKVGKWVLTCVWLPWFGTTHVATSVNGIYTWKKPGHDWYGDLKVMKKKKTAVQASDAKHLAALESTLLTAQHSLIAHCAVTKYDDGDPRQPGWWTVKTMGSAWVVEIKDPDTCARLVVVQQSFDEAVILAALLLESEEAPWEPDPWLRSNAAKQAKKK